MKRVSINGYQAEVLDESKSALLFVGDKRVASVDVPARVSAKWLKTVASEHAADRIEIVHYRYVRYGLRSIMSQRSGKWIVFTNYSLGNGVWKVADRSEKRELY